MKRKTANPIEDAEILQKDGEGPVAYALRIVEMNRRLAQAAGRPVITQKSFVRKQRKLRERLKHSFGALRKGSDPPIDAADPAFVEHMRKIQEKGTGFSNGSNAGHGVGFRDEAACGA